MSLTLIFRREEGVPEPRKDTRVMKVKGYGHPEIVRLFGLTTAKTGPNFNHVNTYDPSGRWNAIARYQTFTDADYTWLKSIQPNFTPQAENWLIGDVTGGGKPSRPMWWANNNQGERVLRCGASVFGENYVLVEARDGLPVEYVFHDVYPGEPTGTKAHPIVFFRVIGMKPEDMGKVSYATHPYWIQRCNQANEGDKIDWYPKGVTIMYPVIDYSIRPLNTKFTDAYIARVFFYGYDG